MMALLPRVTMGQTTDNNTPEHPSKKSLFWTRLHTTSYFTVPVCCIYSDRYDRLVLYSVIQCPETRHGPGFSKGTRFAPANLTDSRLMAQEAPDVLAGRLQNHRLVCNSRKHAPVYY